MDREVIEQKLESLRHCLQRIEQKCPADAQTLADDADLQDIVVLNLSRAVQVCVDIGAHIVSGMQVSAPDTKCSADAQTLAADPDLHDDVALNISPAQRRLDGRAHRVPSPNTPVRTIEMLTPTDVVLELWRLSSDHWDRARHATRMQ